MLPKRQKDISSIDDKIISLYAKGMTTRQISETIEDIYGFEVSEGMVSDITDKLLPRIEEWQNRPLSPVWQIVFIDALHFSVCNDGVIRKLAAYVVLGINEDGMKEVLSIVVGENESSKYWISVLNSLKNRGVQDILILCSYGLTGIKDAISTAFPKTEQQRLERNVTVKMTNFNTIVDTMFRAENKTEYMNELSRCSLLIIDELGLERSSEYALGIIFDVIDHRYRSGKPLITTTNLPLKEIKGESNINKRRIYDRILERCTPILVDGENKREKTAEKNMKYLKTIFEDKETQTTHDPHNA